ncbi:uncharacterized protein MONBRDRAFT_6900 [Monosiga brevicollis MX1]|uniref:Uncharacterized protein n=1 Tax=Monosiga brevicollis TaxID=81824 RepID=A9UUK7_MONBE|nr:uncharacterized protein MONBRDRAFT_6900 [Monosiga brevicollis MX1]EDQ91114.1 predicted protein [Monosiga brevicollis MX1]|eukprot:XP_001744411.1 hypothetical protein [Monosiga brevicollis MX1]
MASKNSASTSGAPTSSSAAATSTSGAGSDLHQTIQLPGLSLQYSAALKGYVLTQNNGVPATSSEEGAAINPADLAQFLSFGGAAAPSMPQASMALSNAGLGNLGGNMLPSPLMAAGSFGAHLGNAQADLASQQRHAFRMSQHGLGSLGQASPLLRPMNGGLQLFVNPAMPGQSTMDALMDQAGAGGMGMNEALKQSQDRGSSRRVEVEASGGEEMMPRIAFKAAVQRLQGEKKLVAVTLTYSEQSCFAYNQGGVTRARSGGSRTKSAPKYVKIPQIRCDRVPASVATLRVELVVLKYLDRAQTKGQHPEPDRQPVLYAITPMQTTLEKRRWVLGHDDHLGASKCAWRFTFLDSREQIVDVFTTPGFLLNCNRTQQRYTAAMQAAQRYIMEHQPLQQDYFLREDASRLLSLYKKTEDDTYYIFNDALVDLKRRISLVKLEELLYVLPRKRPGAKRRKPVNSTPDDVAHRSLNTLPLLPEGTTPKRSRASDRSRHGAQAMTPEDASAVSRLLNLRQVEERGQRPDPLKPLNPNAASSASGTTLGTSPLKPPEARPNPLRPVRQRLNMDPHGMEHNSPLVPPRAWEGNAAMGTDNPMGRREHMRDAEVGELLLNLHNNGTPTRKHPTTGFPDPEPALGGPPSKSQTTPEHDHERPITLPSASTTAATSASRSEPADAKAGSRPGSADATPPLKRGPVPHKA